MSGPFTGRHMAAILVTFFGVVIAVNIVMARYAVSTFGGVVVENSYVASQHFNRWLDEAAVERDLGWKVIPRRARDGRVELELIGAPAGARVSADARHPLGRRPDVPLTFEATSPGRYVSRQALADDRWELRIAVRADDHIWRQETPFR